MRPVTATATAVTTVLGVGAAAVAAGRYAGDVALRSTPRPPSPPTGGLTVHATAAGRTTLTRSFSALRPGTWGLAGPGVHAVVGPVIEGASTAADTVVRRLESVGQGLLEPGARSGSPPSCTAATRAPTSPWTTRTSRSPANWGPCPPGTSPAGATPG
ncbi:prolyl oligopeptidase family serine peptidase [Streptomyces californicus]